MLEFAWHCCLSSPLITWPVLGLAALRYLGKLIAVTSIPTPTEKVTVVSVLSGQESLLSSGVLSHIREGNAEITQERSMWDGAEMPCPGISLLKIIFF